MKVTQKHVLAVVLVEAVIIGCLIWLLVVLPDKEAGPNPSPSTTLSGTSRTESLDEPLGSSPSNPPTTLASPASRKVLPGGTHTFQTYNNCGPASLSMALSHYGLTVSQTELGNQLRPYQIRSGDNDDKSVTLAELAEKAKEFGFTPFHRPNGDFEKIKLFITYDWPVITRTWTQLDEDIGHFRVVKGYDSNLKQLIQDDSLQGKDLTYSEAEFSVLWEKFNYEYVVLVPPEDVNVARAILGPDADERTAWQRAAQASQTKLLQEPGNVPAQFNLAVAKYHLGDFQGSVEAYEAVESQLPFRTLWYQLEPVHAYYELGNYARVLEISDQILQNGNRAYSELYILRGDVYRSQGNLAQARAEYELAVRYNIHLNAARERLEALN